MKLYMQPVWALAAVTVTGCVAPVKSFGLDQQLVIACYRVDVEGVIALIRAGANVNASFGDGNTDVFIDKWEIGAGAPIGSNAWTPLIALASASEYPDPPRKVEDRDRGLQHRLAIPLEQLDRRKRDSIIILLLLLSHNCDLDAHDGYGATALFATIASRKEDLAKILLHYGADVNTKTGVYIDGEGDVTPLHQAHWSADLTRLLLDKGADTQARDSAGNTPLDLARRFGNVDVVRLLELR